MSVATGVAMARSRFENDMKLLGVVRRGRPALMMTTALQATVMLVLSLPADAQPAPNARPTGGSVVAGAAAISQTATNTAINQSSQRAAVNWQSFNVGSRQSVTFNQPSASAVTLNRVTGPDPSQIAGRIDANGQIILVNQSGITFYKGSQVNANGLIVTAAGISTPNFMAGVMTFDQAAKPNARIDNQGTITVKQAGLAALVAPQVANSGVINARLGHVVLAGAKTATLDLYGDGLLSLDVTNQVVQAPRDASGQAATALVTNTGVIQADGGTVQLTARAADGIVANLVEAGGKIRAASVGAQTGVVALNGVGGSIVVEGQLSAPGIAAGTMGGAVEVVTDKTVTIASTAKVSANGKAGGGVVALGTTLDRARGGPSVTPAQTAANTVIQQGAKISANATGKGDGGRVTVLSTQSTTMAGTIAAKGGPSGGNGGTVEVSGGTLSLTGTVDASAPLGVTGSILLDPLDLFISAENPENGSGLIAPSATGVAADGQPSATTSSWLTPASIANLAGAVTIATTRDLTVLSALNTAQSKITTLTLDAGRNLTVNIRTGITTAGSLLLSAGNITPAGTLTIGSPIQSLTGSVFMQAHAGNINQNASVTANGFGQLVSFRTDGTVNFTASKAASGAQIQAAAGTIELGPTTDNTLLVDGGFDHDFVALSYRIGQTTNPFTNILGPKASTINLGDTAGAGGALSFTNVAAIDLEAHGAITETASSITNLGNGGLTLTGGGGAVTLGAAGNAFSTLGPFTATGNFILANNNALNVTGPVNAGAGDLTIVNASNLTLSGVITANNLFFEVANRQGTGILTLGSSPPVLTGAVVEAAVVPSVPATLTATAANGRISLVADNYVVASTKSTITTTAGTVQLAPFTAVNTSLLGGDIAGLIVGGDLLNAIHTNGGTLEVGGFTNVPVGATVPTASAATVTIDGAVNLTGIASTLRLDAVGAITEPGGPLTVTTLTGNAGSATLGNTKNLIANLAAFTTGSDLAPGGDFTLMDAGPLAVIGPVSAGGTLTPTPANTARPVNSATLSLTAGGTLTIGTTGSAAKLSAGTVVLSASGAITEPNGSIAADSFTATTTSVNGLGGGDVLLTSANNKIAASTGITAANGVVAFLDDPTLVLSGLYTGANLFFEVTLPGGSLALGGERPATLATTGSGGRISLVADNIGVGNPASSVTATAGTVQLAPVSAINTSLLGTSGLVIAPTLLSIVRTAGGTLEVGGFTNVPLAATVPAASAGSVTIDGATNLTGIAATLRLDSIGSITQTAGPLTVANLTGNAGTSASLIQPTNQIGTLGAFTTSAGFALVDNQALLVAGPVTDTGATSTLALTIKAGNITLAGTVDATNIVDLISAGAINQTGGSLIAGTLTGTAATSASLTQPTNLVGTLGAFSTTAGFALLDNQSLLVDGPISDTGATSTLALTTKTGGITLAGDVATGSGIIQITSIGDITQSGNSTVEAGPGGAIQILAGGNLSQSGTARIFGDTVSVNVGGNVEQSGNAFITTVQGGKTNTDTVTAGGNIVQSDSGAILAVNAVDITAGGNLTQTGSASILSSNASVTVNVKGSIASSGNSSITAPTISLTTGPGGVALTDSATMGEAGSVIDITSAGPVTEAATSAIVAGTLTSSGNIAGPVSLAGAANAIAELRNVTVTGTAGSFQLTDSVDLLIAGTLNATQIQVRAPTSQISLGDGATIMTGGTVRPAGPLQSKLEPSQWRAGRLLPGCQLYPDRQQRGARPGRWTSHAADLHDRPRAVRSAAWPAGDRHMADPRPRQRDRRRQRVRQRTRRDLHHAGQSQICPAPFRRRRWQRREARFHSAGDQRQLPVQRL